MTKNVKLALMLGSSLMLIGGVAMAQAPSDADRAAKRAQMKEKREARRAEMLAQFDTNNDGRLDENERQAMHDARATQRFQTLDTNNDGVLSLDEFKAGQRDFGKKGKGFGKGRRGGR